MGMAMPRGVGKSRRPSIWVTGLAVVAAVSFAAIAYMYLTLPDVRGLAEANPITTAFMELRDRQAEAEGKEAHRVYTWVPYRRISPHLKRAVLVAEDSAFWEHEGIDLEQIKVAIETAIERGDAPRGASTITQQLAKNLYLSPSYDPFRKLRELIITRRLEAALPKARILELYLNVVEWGDGVWGAEAAARRYFGVSAASLSRPQSALLAGALINPIRYSPGRPPARLLRRQQIILGRMASVEAPSAPLDTAPSRAAASAQAEELDSEAEPAVVPEVAAEPGAGEVDQPPVAQP
jgi:monofunctional biosynthetic peptidoglycan transglycosylase